MSSIRPKDHHVFDFFFHPEKTKGTTKVFSIITNIALSLVLNILYLVPFTIIHLKTRTKDTPVNPEKTEQVAKTHFQKEMDQPQVPLAPLSAPPSEAHALIPPSDCNHPSYCPSVEKIAELSLASPQAFDRRIILAKMLLSELEQAFLEQNTLVSSAIDTPNYFSKHLCLIKSALREAIPDANPETFKKELDAILQTFITLSFSNEEKEDYRFSTTFEERCFLVSRLTSESAAENLKDTLKEILEKYNINKFTTTVGVPHDGNCFLWACAASNKLSTLKDLSIKDVSQFNVRSECEQNQGQMRQQMLDQFDMLIRSGSQEELQSFMTYIAYNNDFKSIRQGISEEELLMQILEGKPSEQIIAGYKKKLDTKGFWNGDFEVNLLARALKKPIIVFFKNQHQEQSTVFGGSQFYPQSEPLLIKYSNHHYEALVPFAL